MSTTQGRHVTRDSAMAAYVPLSSPNFVICFIILDYITDATLILKKLIYFNLSDLKLIYFNLLSQALAKREAHDSILFESMHWLSRSIIDELIPGSDLNHS